MSKKRILSAGHPADFNNKDNLQADKENRGYRNKKIRDAGRRALKNGQTLERLITILGFDQSLKDEPEFELIRNYDAMQKSYSTGGKIGAHTTGPSSCDFSFWTNSSSFGCICGGMIEAKSRESASINKSALSDHQKKQLIRMEKMGQLGLILVKIVTDETQYYLVPVTHWFRGDKKSHNEKDLRSLGYRLKMIPIHDEVTNQTIEVPDIFSVIHQIDNDGGVYKSIPAEYAELSDNKKLKNAIYSTIDRDFEEFDVEIDD